MIVWLVWTEWGSYDDFSRDLRGVFEDEGLARDHANRLRADKSYDLVDVRPETVLDRPPLPVTLYEYSAHILPDGTEDTGLGFHRGPVYESFDNELRPASGRVGLWHGRRSDRTDRYVEVRGYDEAAVAAKYERLLGKARRRLGVAPSAALRETNE